jgi:hypothetical protein
MVARIKGVQTDCRQLSHCMIRSSGRTGSWADNAGSSAWARRGASREGKDVLDSDTPFLDDLVRKSSGESDDGTLGRGVVEELGSASPLDLNS